MKKFINFALMIVFCVTATTFISCNNDEDDTVIPAKSVNEVHGNYTGKITYGSENEKDVNVTVDSVSKKIIIEKLPVSSVIKEIVDKTQLEEALKSYSTPTCEMPYKATLSKNLIKMEMDSCIVLFSTKIKNNTQNIAITIGSKGEGIYNATTQKLNIAFAAEKVSINGNEVKDFKSIKYLYSQTRKK